MPYKDEARVAALKQMYGINGIPTLVVLNKQGVILSHEGRKDIQSNGGAALQGWMDKEEELKKQ